MAKFLISSFVVSAMAAGGIVFVSGSPDHSISVENDIVQDAALVQEAHSWLLTNLGNNEICLMERSKRVSGSTHVLELDPTCSEVLPAAEELAVWQQADSDNVVLANQTGKAVLEFEWNDEEGWISIADEPGRYQLSPNS